MQPCSICSNWKLSHCRDGHWKLDIPPGRFVWISAILFSFQLSFERVTLFANQRLSSQRLSNNYECNTSSSVWVVRTVGKELTCPARN